ncbi:MAG: heme-copper oxidase subunit III [Caulobacter sp.]|nr:heme-copper oxidase subunit III [Caulobacter sp.]
MAEAIRYGQDLPVGARGRNSTGWWGLLCLIATEGSLFAYLLFSYVYIAIQRGSAWLPDPHPSLKLAGPNTLILLASSVCVWWAERGIKRNHRGQLLAGLAAAVILGTAFLGIQVLEWSGKDFSLSSGSYGSLYFVITGFHMAHVIVGIAILLCVLGWSATGAFTRRRHEPVTLGGLYWHFVDVVWLFVFSTFYLSPRLIG